MTRRTLLKSAMLLAAGTLPEWNKEPTAMAITPQSHKMRLPSGLSHVTHFVIATQENRSFDQYFGFYPGTDGIPQGVCMPNPDGSCVAPYHFSSPIEGGLNRPNHSWDAIHAEWDDGRMDGFVKVNGRLTMGYYLKQDLPYYWKLAFMFHPIDADRVAF